jgi:uncharacterized protein YecT (DUF1311 family)
MRDVELSIEYPQTGLRPIDAVLLGYARRRSERFKDTASDHQADQAAYTLKITYEVERNDGKMFAIVFTEFSDTGGAHPNSEFATYDFLRPDGAQLFLPEILDGQRGVKRLSDIVIADLLKTVAAGPNAMSDKDWLDRGVGPLATNFRSFVWLPDKVRIYFPPYQVAAYAAGPQDVSIPLSSLNDVIRPDWRAPAASFDCARARSAIERAICADAALARLDRQVAEIYRYGMQNLYSPAEREKLRRSQRDFLATRDRTCSGDLPKNCLTKLYSVRLAALTR